MSVGRLGAVADQANVSTTRTPQRLTEDIKRIKLGMTANVDEVKRQSSLATGRWEEDGERGK